MKLPVRRIIPFSNVEGLGNRTSIFVQGCNANCIYCHNSETIPMQANDVTYYETDKLVDIIKSHMPFIRGITVSGGEATLYDKPLIELFNKVHELGLSCYMDTNGFFDYDKLSDLVQVTDKFLFDIKGIGSTLEDLCFSSFQHEGAVFAENYNERFIQSNVHIQNLKKLLTLDKVEEVRLVFIKGYYNAKEVVSELAKLLQPYPTVNFKLIRVHARGLPIDRAKKLKGAVPTAIELSNLEHFANDRMSNKVIVIN